jgi:hypothetical protein
MLVKRGRANKKRKLARETGSVQFMISINLIRLSDLHQLEGDFTKEEVWTVIKVMSMDKCSSPDGFTRFFMSRWSIIEGGIMQAFGSLSSLDSYGFRATKHARVTLLLKSQKVD